MGNPFQVCGAHHRRRALGTALASRQQSTAVICGAHGREFVPSLRSTSSTTCSWNGFGKQGAVNRGNLRSTWSRIRSKFAEHIIDDMLLERLWQAGSGQPL